MLHTELQKMGIKPLTHEIIREKDGITVARIHTKDDTFVLKYFENPDFRREIANYRLLNVHGVPTLKIYGETDCSILMEDVSASENLRLGEEKDMSDPEIAAQLAKWYKKLHSVNVDLTGMYDESDFFTLENIRIIKEKTRTSALPAWKILEENFHTIKSCLEKLRPVLNYNDFYYTNLIVARDKSRAFMFDYNYLGKGFAINDVRNVTYSLSKEAAQAFLAGYGPADPMEQAVYDVISPVTTLFMACRRENFPEWGKEALETVKNSLPEKIRVLTEVI